MRPARERAGGVAQRPSEAESRTGRPEGDAQNPLITVPISPHKDPVDCRKGLQQTADATARLVFQVRSHSALPGGHPMQPKALLLAVFTVLTLPLVSAGD